MYVYTIQVHACITMYVHVHVHAYMYTCTSSGGEIGSGGSVEQMLVSMHAHDSISTVPVRLKR